MPSIFDNMFLPQTPAGPAGFGPPPQVGGVPALSPGAQVAPAAIAAPAAPQAASGASPEESLNAWQRFTKKLQETPGAARGLIAFGASMMQPGDAGANFGKGALAFSNILDAAAKEGRSIASEDKAAALAERRVVTSEAAQATSQQKADDQSTLFSKQLEQLDLSIAGLRKDLDSSDANQAANLAFKEAQTAASLAGTENSNLNTALNEFQIDEVAANRLRTANREDEKLLLREQELALLTDFKASESQRKQQNKVMDLVQKRITSAESNFQPIDIPKFVAEAKQIVAASTGEGSDLGGSQLEKDRATYQAASPEGKAQIEVRINSSNISQGQKTAFIKALKGE